ncbi:TetR/AcrR family transcriptional regulator [Rhizobium sp. PL01]|uniref:TetR/AcrR family transcriptional regulator n=1 Tax=Rhizobium sp. PL01 TaxID=3085631 RepID=UPI002980E7A6|nr:TetR/AcrR family transcriptional regulator [Rhizobium sp. PL01]MDW5318468.1 TetR/AcrR family transcriptional regulator [Rhizobium sp. PL01]
MPRPLDPANKRQQIIDTAYELFSRSGYHATGTDRIIAEANVAKMTMYRNFSTKDALIVEVLNYRAAHFDARLDRLAEGASTPREKIDTIFDWYERWFMSIDFHGCLFAHALAEFGEPGHPVFDAVAEHKNSLKDRLLRILGPAMNEDQAISASDAIFMLLEGATLMAQMGQGPKAIRHARQAASSILGIADG